MLLRRFYYTIKPFVPWAVRMAVRRALAMRARRGHADKWPILPGSERPPKGWPGWPEGKKFAFVLTHDVEGRAGLEKVRALMELELQLGFRSAFYFIPEGEYRVPPELREELVRNGFEVAVHDLYHDGKLFNSRKRFREHAVKINRYLHEWGAVGFRAGFMLHQLNWLHELDILYDASTFDTDPFEPQPEGVGTIFPFWVANHLPAEQKDSGVELDNIKTESISTPGALPMETSKRSCDSYIELPYTLTQDSTLFLLLREKSIDIWRRKLDWVAQHGGMVLVNVHPDYLDFERENTTGKSVKAAFYVELLQNVRDKYGGNVWHALPRQVASYVQGLPRISFYRPKRRICMVTHSFYDGDTRVMNYAEALVERGDRVDVVALRQGLTQPPLESLAGVSVHRIQIRSPNSKSTKLGYLWSAARFFLASSLWVTFNHMRRQFDLVHVHNVPDFLVFCAWLPKLAGRAVILDIHDILPEFYASKFHASNHSLAIKVLLLAERWSARFADHVILANHLWLDKYAKRTGPGKKCSIFINYVDMRRFHPRPRTRKDDRIIVLFPGGLQWHQGVDIAIRAFQKVALELPSAEFHIYGDGKMKQNLEALTSELGLSGKVRFFDPLPVDRIADIIGNANLGVVPKRADSFGNEAYSTKIMEFMAAGVPVVVSDTKIDRFYFDESVVKFFPSGDENALAEAMLRVIKDEKMRTALITNGMQYAARNSWQARKQEYLKIVDSLISA